MKRSIPFLTFTGAAVGSLAAAPAVAADLSVNFTIPTQKVAEYHAPFVAIWIENSDGAAAGTLAVWYKPHHEKWLKDMRKWWRKAGREMTFPADGVSGATHAPGPQKLTFSDAKGPLKGLKPGQYNLVIDAAREAGGYEAVSVPFTWGQTGGKPGKPATANGVSELGVVTVTVK